MIRKSFKTAFVAVTCSFALAFGASSAYAQHGAAPPHGDPEAKPSSETHGEAVHEPGGGHAKDNHEGGHHGPKPMNIADFSNKETPPYAALLVNFGLLAFAYYSLGKKPIAEALKQRKEDIGKEIELSQKLLDDAVARGKSARKKLKNVEDDKKTALNALIETGEGERDKLIREAQEKAERVGRDAGFLVDQEAKQLRLDLTREAVENAVAKAEALLQGAVTQADHERIAEEFLAELGSKAEAGKSAGGAA